jgi:ATP-dependent Clp protease protease subunit
MIKVENRIGKVRLTESVTPDSVETLIEEIETLYGAKAVSEEWTFANIVASADDALEELHIELHSGGGSVFDGWRLYQALMDMRGRVKVVATINSLAASMASVVAMAADVIRIVRGGKLMIHEAATVTWGNAAEHFSAAQNLEEISDSIAQVYADRTGRTKDEMREAMRNTTWYGAEDARRIGLVDEIISGTATRADFDVSQLPMNIFRSDKELVEKIAGMEATLAEITAEHLADQDRLADALTRIEESATTIAQLRESVASLTAAKEAAEVARAEAERRHAEAQIELEALREQAALTTEKISIEAARQLASLGQPPVDLEPSGNEVAPDILQQFGNLTGSERTKFFNANRDKIRAALKKFTKTT